MNQKGYTLAELTIGFVAGLLFLAFSFSMWQVGRWANYKFSYKAMVQDTIREMVKEEALK